MLDTMRKHSGSFIIYVLFAIIILVFVVNFGPQSAGCTAGTSFAAKVSGRTISLNDYSYALAISGMRSRDIDARMMPQLRAMVMDQLLVRELLAQEAYDIGFRVGDQEIDDMIVQGRFLAMGRAQPLIRNEEGAFDYDLFSRWVRHWGTTVKGFKEHQRRELLAEKLMSVMRSALKVSEDEVKADYIHRNTQVQLEYIRLPATDYLAEVTLEPEEIETFRKNNTDRIARYYEENRVAYTGLPKQIKVRAIQLTGEDQTKIEKTAQHVLEQITGGKDFGTLAIEHSVHWSKRNRGSVGWRNLAAAGLDKKVDDALKTLTSDEPQLISGDQGTWIVQILGRREGDQSLDVVGADIAEELLRSESALSLAQAQAKRYLEEIKEDQQLSDVFATEGSAALLSEDAAQDSSRPKVLTTALFSRDPGNIVPGVGESKELMERVFKMKAGEVARDAVVVANNVYLIGVKQHTHADLAQWEQQRDELISAYLDRRWAARRANLLRQRCVDAYERKRIEIFVRLSPNQTRRTPKQRMRLRRRVMPPAPP